MLKLIMEEIIMKGLIIIAVLLVISTSLIAQNFTIKKISDKEFEVINSDTTANLYIELWMNNKYLGEGKLNVQPGDSLIHNVDNWQFVQKEEFDVTIESIGKHSYKAGAELPNSEIEDIFLTLQITESGYTTWRIYLRD